MTIRTERLILRQWQQEDFEPFAKLNNNLQVMEYFPSTLSRQESDDLAQKILSKIENEGWGPWAVSIPNVAEFIGFIGLSVPTFQAHFTPTIEVEWRLDPKFWGNGYATEGALACLRYGFETLNLEEIVSFTAVQNIRSRAVMERIGMYHDPKDDFDHPRLAEGHRLRRHVLYRLEVQKWQNQNNTN